MKSCFLKGHAAHLVSASAKDRRRGWSSRDMKGPSESHASEGATAGNATLRVRPSFRFLPVWLRWLARVSRWRPQSLWSVLVLCGACASCVSRVIGQFTTWYANQHSNQTYHCERLQRRVRDVRVCSQRGGLTVVSFCCRVERNVHKHTPRSTPGACGPWGAVAGPWATPWKLHSVPSNQPPWIRYTAKSM